MVDYVSLFVSVSLVAVTAVLAYFTYILGGHTKTLSKIPIMPHFIQDLEPSFNKGIVSTQYRNSGNGVAVHVKASKRAEDGQEFSLEQNAYPRDSIAVNTIVGYDITPRNNETFNVILEYEDISGNSYKQEFVFHKIKESFHSLEIGFK